MIYDPLREFNEKFKTLHLENTKKHLEELVGKSEINIEENRKTVKEYNDLKERLPAIKKKYNLWRLLRVLAILTIVSIPLVIKKITPKGDFLFKI